MPLNKVAKRRILKLVEFMEKLPRSAAKHFDMGSWFTHNGDHELPLKSGDAINADTMKDCGTTACALGWAATMPYFRKLGLKCRLYGRSGDIVFQERKGTDFSVVQCGLNPLFPYLDGHQYMDLFSGENEDPTPKAWAKRVRKLVKEWSAA